MKSVYVYKAFERFWHWMQALLVIFLGLTGFEIHGAISFFGFDQAVRYHNIASLTFLGLIAFAIFWHLTTGEWRQYIPTSAHIRAQIHYYLIGIFRGEPHPMKKTALSKLNPLQKLVYLALKILVFPVMVASGLLYMFYRYPQRHDIAALNIGGLQVVALLHTAGAFFLVAFLIVHLYLITTGHTATSNLRAMITGWEELEGDSAGTSHPASAHTVPEEEGANA
jgi:thiosulfate reductase cytochrome b subunit